MAAVDILALESYRASAWRFQPGHDPRQGGFPAPTRPGDQKGVGLPRPPR